MAKRMNLTAEVIEAATPAGATVFLWDSEVPRLGLMVTKTGHKGYVYQYTRKGRDRRMTLGAHPALTLSEARVRAAQLGREVAAGGDPAEVQVLSRKVPTVRELAHQFLEQRGRRLKPSTIRSYRQILKNYILHSRKGFGGKLVPEVTYQEVATLAYAMRDTPILANRMLSTVSAMWAYAIKAGAIPRGSDNPGRGHDRYAEHPGERGEAPTPEELRRIGDTLRSMGPTMAGTAFQVAMLTGCRIGEACAMRWQDLGVDGVWRLPDSKTGARRVYLGAAARDLLAEHPRLGLYVFPSSRLDGQPIRTIDSFWRRLKASAELPETLRAYDCTRHAYISAGAELGIEAQRLRRLAGHSTGADIHQRYQHLRPEILLADASKIAALLWGRLTPAEATTSRATAAA